MPVYDSYESKTRGAAGREAGMTIERKGILGFNELHKLYKLFTFPPVGGQAAQGRFQ